MSSWPIIVENDSLSLLSRKKDGVGVCGMSSDVSAILVFLSASNCYSLLVYNRQLLLDIQDSFVATYNPELKSSVAGSQSCSLPGIFQNICAVGLMGFPAESAAGDAASAEGLLSNWKWRYTRVQLRLHDDVESRLFYYPRIGFYVHHRNLDEGWWFKSVCWVDSGRLHIL